MADTSAKKADFISQAVELSNRTVALLNDFDAILTEWNTLSYGSAGTDEIVQGDITGGNVHIDPADLQNLLFSVSEIDRFVTGQTVSIGAVHRANFIKAKR